MTLTNIDLNIIFKTALTYFIHVLLKSSQLSIIFFLHYYCYSALRISFLKDLNKISPQFALFSEDVFAKALLYDNPIFDENDNQEILETSFNSLLYHLSAIVCNNIKESL